MESGVYMKDKLNNIQKLFEVYPILKEINDKNNKIIENKCIFKELKEGQYISSIGNECEGILFVNSGVIKIQKINVDGDETNLYNISTGELCHEALSCMVKCESLNIIARALEDSEIYILNIEEAKNILLKNVEFLEYMYKDIYLKFNNILSNKEKIIHEPLQNRLIQLLISKKSDCVYSKHSELAFEIDSTRETVSRKLKTMEKIGYVKLSRGKIFVLKDLRELLS